MKDMHRYFADMAKRNKLADALNFCTVSCSGINHLDGVLDRYDAAANFIAVDDVCDEATFRDGGGWFKRKLYTVFLLMRFEHGDENDRREKMETCRELLRQFQSGMLRDAADFVREGLYVHHEDIRSRELGGIFLTDCTGLYFMLYVDEPIDIAFRPEEWNDEDAEP